MITIVNTVILFITYNFLVVNTYVTLTREFFKMPAILSKIING